MSLDLEIINDIFSIGIYGYGATAVNNDYSGTAFRLSGRMWDAVKANVLENKGKNIWVYDKDKSVFAGVELTGSPAPEIGLEHKIITLHTYAYFKHIGSYNLLKQAGLLMRNELSTKGYETRLPYIEIYGHWTTDETNLETELLIALSPKPAGPL